MYIGYLYFQLVKPVSVTSHIITVCVCIVVNNTCRGVCMFTLNSCVTMSHNHTVTPL